MDFSLSPEELAIQQTFRSFADRELKPAAAELDQHPRFPEAHFRRAGELGFFGMRYPEPLGSGATVLAYILAVEELARGNLAVAAACTMQSLMGTWFLQRFGDAELQERLLEPALAGRMVGAICMTEPDAGSDLGAMSTRAVLRDGRWHLTGRKTWVTSAPAARFFTVFARTGEKELSVFLVERDTDGVSLGRDIQKLGVRASLTSEVHFDEAPATCLLGAPGKGMGYLREILAEIRVMTAALALGVGQAAYEEALRYSTERHQFGRPIGDYQAIQAHLAEMSVDLEAARQLVRWAAWRSDQGHPNALQASQAKLFASEAALRTCEHAARVFASYGYASEYPIERYLRDVRFVLIGGGTSEILRTSIARELLR